MAEILIAGMPGIGKTETVTYMHDVLGRDARDGDDIAGLLQTLNSDSQPVDYDPTDPDFAATHTTHWSEEVVQQVLGEPRDAEYLYLAGMAFNLPDLIARGLFNRTIYLDADDETLRQRFTSPIRRNPDGFGIGDTHPKQIDDTIAMSGMAREIAAEIGAYVLDTSQMTVAEVGNMVVHIAETA